MIDRNVMLDKLRAGGIAIGTQLRSRSPLIAELLGYLGYDFLYIESEHFPFNIETVENLIRACDLGSITPIIRISSHDEGQISQLLDMGIGSIILPHVDTKEEAEAMMRISKYAPHGERGFSDSCRAAKLGTLPLAEYRRLSNQNTTMIPMIESREAVANLDAIFDCGVELIRIGLRDLSSSFGYEGEQNHADLQRAVDEVIKKANDRHIAVGCAANSLKDAEEKIGRGFRQISFASDLGMIRSFSSDVLEQLRKA